MTTLSTPEISRAAPTYIAPYRAVDSGKPVHAVFEYVNSANYQGFGTDYRLGPGVDKIVADTLAQYDRFLHCLASRPDVEFLPHCELAGRSAPADRILCGIRHDVDSDIRAALTEAELEHRRGIRSTFYILHTAPYYGEFKDGVLHRHEGMAHVYRAIQDFGHEIALHTDALHLYQDLAIDGAEAIEVELDWLRRQGLRIVGTVGHNSASVYGAENWQIFKGRTRRAPDEVLAPNAPSPTEVIHKGKWAPLEVLDEGELGLLYEGNDVFWNKTSPLEYGATRFTNRWRWNAHIARVKKNPDWTEHPQFIDQDRLHRDLLAMPAGRILIVNVHPVFYGLRHAGTAAPAFRINRLSTMLNPDLGWETYKPDTVQAQGGDIDVPPARTGTLPPSFQAINHTDELGMIDVPRRASANGADELRVLVLGGTNIDGNCTTVPEHASAQAADRLRSRLNRPVWIRKLAHPGMGMARLFGWFRRKVMEIRPQVVVMGIGADELAVSLPEFWKITTGFDPNHPPGEYLRAVKRDGGIEVEAVNRSPGAFIRRGRPRPIDADENPSLALPGAAKKWQTEIARIEAIAARLVAEIRMTGAQPLFLLQECGESAGLWRPGVNDEASRDGHERCLAVLGPMMQRVGAPLVNPYALFLAERDLPSHWTSHPQWNYTGQRLAGAALMRAIDSIASDSK